jgi:hypothetical protein
MLYAGDKSAKAIASPVGDITVSWVPCRFYVELTSLCLIMVNKTSISMVLAASVVNSDVEVTLETVKSFGMWPVVLLGVTINLEPKPSKDFADFGAD